MGLFAVTIAFLAGIVFTLVALVAAIVIGLGKITNKFEKTATENKYPDVGNKQYEPSPKKPNPPPPPPLVYLNNNGTTSGIVTSSSTTNLASLANTPYTSATAAKSDSELIKTGASAVESVEPKQVVGHRRAVSSASASVDFDPAVLLKPEASGLQSAKDKKPVNSILREGFLEVKDSKDWAKRFIVLRKGYLSIYKTEKAKERDYKSSGSVCVGLIKLEGCTLNLLQSKKKGKFPFEVVHNKRARIYCHAGPNGERVAQKFPVKFDRILLQTREREDLEQWTVSIEEAINEAPPFLKFTGEDDGFAEMLDDKTEGGSDTESGEEDSDDEDSDTESAAKVMDDLKEAIDEEKVKEPEVVVVKDQIVIPSEEVPESTKAVGKDGELKINLKTWMKYYFIIGHGVLAFYKSNDMKDMVGAIQLEGCEVTPVDQQSDAKKKKKLFIFEVTHPDKKAIFMKESASGRKLNITPPLAHVCQMRAKTENSRAEWIAAIQLMINGSKQTANIPLVSPDAKAFSAQWINVLLNRHFKDMANSKVFHNEMMRKMKKKFETLNRPDFLGPVVCEKIFFGTEMVQVKSIKMTGTSTPNEIVGEADLVYNGGGGLEVNTELYVSWLSTSIPVNAVVKVTHLAGKLHLHLPAQLGARLTAFFAKLPEVEFSVEVLMGEKQRKATNLPTFKKFLISTLRRALRQQLVYPNKITLHLPFPGRKMDLKTETWGSLFRRRTTYNTREAPLPLESTDVVARKFCVARFINEIFNNTNFTDVEELCAKDIIIHGYNPFAEDALGYEGVKDVAREIKTGFSNGKFSISDLAIETNNAFCRWKFRGVHDGPFWDTDATNEEMLLTGITVIQFNTDKIYEVWMYWDPSSVFAF